MRQCPCGNARFHAHQRATLAVIVDGGNNWLENLDSDGGPLVEDPEKPEGPFMCTECERVFESLDELDKASE